MVSQIKGYVLSPHQRHLWLVQQDGQIFRSQIAILLEGEVNKQALEDALYKIVNRHDILRTTFPIMSGLKVPIQSITGTASQILRIVDLMGESENEQRASVDQILKDEAWRLDQNKELPCQTCLIGLSPNKHILLISLPALCADAWTLKVMFEEVLKHYQAWASNEEIAEDIAQYVQFADWQNEMLNGDDESIEQESGITDEAVSFVPLSFPFENGSEVRGQFDSEVVSTVISPSLFAEIKQAARDRDVSLSSWLLACWQALLWRLTEIETVTVHNLFDGRQTDELKTMPGLFARMLPVKVQFNERLRFDDLLKRVESYTADIYENQDYFRWELIRTNDAVTHQKKIAQRIGFDLFELPGKQLGKGVAFSILKQDVCLDRFKIRLSCVVKDNLLTTEFHYDSEVFTGPEIERLSGQFQALLQSAVAWPDAIIGALEIIGASEKHELLDAFNATESDYAKDKCFHHLFEQQAATTPANIAVEFEGEHLAYAELNARANQIANYLQRLGVGPDALVGLCIERTPDMVCGLIGILKAGGAYVPLDPSYPKERLNSLIEDAGISILLTQESLLNQLPETAARIICLDADWQSIAREATDNPSSTVAAENLAYVIFTSGSTGKPKGVMIRHCGLVNYLSWCTNAYRVTEGSGSIVHSSIGFDLTVTSLCSPLMVGKRVKLVREDRSLETFRKAMLEDNDNSLIKITPAHLEVLNRLLPANQLDRRTRALIIGGEALFEKSISFWQMHAPTTRIINEYGPTETVVGCGVYEVTQHSAITGSVPIGRPIANTKIYLLDKYLNPVPTGVSGELFVGGDGLARGYLDMPDLTAESFIPDPFSPRGGERLYRTGDSARFLPDGNLEFLGRRDHQVKIKSFRVELGEIENVLSQHESVKEAIVIVREDKEEEKLLVGYVVGSNGSRPEPIELLQYLKDKLPDYMIPSSIVVLDEMPLTANGKIDRRALPSPSISPRKDQYQPPRTYLEEMLAAIWQQVLGVEEVGIHDNFFALSGDSIRSVQAVSRAKERGLEITVQDIFEHQTINELAQKVLMRGGDDATSLKTAPMSLISQADRMRLPDEIEDAYPLTMLQAGMLYHMEMTPESPAYHNVNSYHIQGLPFDEIVFLEVIKQLLSRHAVLRTSINTTDYSEPLQLVHKSVPLPVEIVDLRGMSPADQQDAVSQIVNRERVRTFDITRPPLVRFHILLRGEEGFQFLLTELHVVSDGWSTTSMFSEIFDLYTTVIDGQPLPVDPPPPALFREYVYLERQAIDSEDCRNYWKEKLSDSSPLELPRRPEPKRSVEEPLHRRIDFHISQELFDGIKSLSRTAVVPLKSVLLAAHLKVLSMLSWKKDVMTGLHVHGRPETVGSDEARGLFLNTPPFRLTLEGGTWVDLVRQTFEAERGMLPFQRYPMAALQKEMGTQALPKTMFGFLNFHALRAPIKSGRLIVDLETSMDLGETNYSLLNIFHLGPFPNEFDYPAILILEYDTSELCEEQINTIAGYFYNVLTAMATEPFTLHYNRCLLSEAEQLQIISEWNETDTDFPKDRTIQELFDDQASATPHLIAVESDGIALSYSELSHRANQLAHFLKRLGVQPEQLVAVFMDRSVDMVVSMLAILKAGAGYLPIDTQFPAQRVKFMLEDSSVKVILTNQQFEDSLPDAEAEVVCLDRQWEQIAAEPDYSPVNEAYSDNIAYVMYTSGSTGEPKGVMITHRAVVRLVIKTNYIDIGMGDAIAQVANASFDAATFEVWGGLLNGGKVIIIPKDVALSASEFAQQIKSKEIEVMFLTTALFNQLAAEGAEVYSGLKALLFGGEAVEPRWVREVKQAEYPKRLLHVYGPTEGTTFSTWHEVEQVEDGAKTVAIGRALANTEMYVLNEDMQVVPVGVIGEVYIGGEGLARGYIGKAGMTAEKFVPHPFSEKPGGRLYRTGDLARWQLSGELEFVGRIDDQVKIRGFRVEPGEIEAVLKNHELVQDSVVTVREDSRQEKQLIGYVVIKEGRELSANALLKYVKEKLPDYMTPSAIVMLKEIPLTPNGKIDRRALPEPDTTRDYLPDYADASNPIEAVIAEVWADVLGLEQVGIHDDFYTLGGHSLLATKVISRLRRVFNKEIPLRYIFESSTVNLLAQRIEVLMKGEPRPVPAIKPVDRSKELPLSYAQQRLWFIEQLNPGTPVYNIACAVRMQGLLNIAALESSINRIISRHESLRTRFGMLDGRPEQIIDAARPVKLDVVELASSDGEQRRAEIERLIEEEATKSFNLSEGPLMRMKLMRETASEHVAVLVMHHIISDGWSMGVLVKELGEGYRKAEEGREEEEEKLEIQYADYASWQRGWMRGEVLEEEMRYWREQLKGAEGVVRLRTDRERPEVRRDRGAIEEIKVGKELSEGLKELSRREGVTMFMTLLGALDVLLYRYTGQEDINVGTPIANRNRVEAEALIGLFVNTLVLRADLSQNLSFKEFLSRQRETVIDAYVHQDVPFEKIVEEMQTERNLSYTPLFQVMLILQNATEEELQLPGLKLIMQEQEAVSSKFDLLLSFSETPDGLEGRMQYSTDLFYRATIQRMLRHFENILEGIVANPHARLSELPMLSPSELHDVLLEWNQTDVDFQDGQCIHRLFEDQARRSPEAIAVMDERGGLTYQQLNERANQLARYIKPLGVGPDVLVGLCAGRNVDVLVGLLSILKAGGAYVPIDSSMPDERLQLLLEDSKPPVVLTLEEFESALPETTSRVICIDRDWNEIARESAERLVDEVTADNLAYVMYTSGTTGRPKGVMIEHGSVINLSNALYHAIDDFNQNQSLKITLNGPLSFDTSVKQLIHLAHGHSLLFVPEEIRTDGDALLSFLKNNQVDVFDCTPSQLEMLISSGLLDQNEPAAKCVLIGGESIAESMWRKLVKAHHTNFYNVYGPTECTVDATVCRIDESVEKVTVGRPLANVKTYILDRNLQPVPAGVVGELHIAGAGLARGYYNDPTLTAAKFIQNRFEQEPNSRMYESGDLAYFLPDGNIAIVGRIDEQVKLRGFRIELNEIEAAIAQYKDVRESVVLLRQDSPGHEQLVAYIVADKKALFSTDELRLFLKKKLFEYMIPSAFVLLDTLPLTPNGKLDRRALPLPKMESSQAMHARNPIEDVIAGIWCEALDVEQVGVFDNFFELGGHSLLATMVISHINSAFSIDLKVRNIFDQPTIAGLADLVGSAFGSGEQSKVAAIERAPRNENIPLSYAQQRLWLLNQIDPDSTAYNIPDVLRLKGSLDVPALTRSLNEIIRRHEILRTTFKNVQGEPRQTIETWQVMELPVIDLRGLDEAEREAAASRVKAEEGLYHFDLSRGPLIRTCLLWLDEDDYLLLLTMHHIISDGWSKNILIDELTTLYKASTSSHPSPLPELPIQYADFAVWQRERLQGEVLDSQLHYWNERLGGDLPILDLPTDHPKPPTPTLKGASSSLHMEKSLYEGLKSFSRHKKATLFMSLLAAFKTLLYRYTGQDDIIVGTPIAARNRSELEPIIGFFVNMLALRTRLSDHLTFSQLLDQVRETLLQAYAFQDLPFDKLVEAISPERNLSLHPVFQTTFSFEPDSTTQPSIASLSVTREEVETATSKFDLSLGIQETAEGVVATIEYSTELFDETTIARMLGHLRNLLESIIENPEQAISEMRMLTDEEREQMVREWNETEKEYRTGECVHEMIEEAAARNGEAVAVEEGGERISYEEMNGRANQMGRYLRKKGLRAEERVGIEMERGIEMVISVLGVMKAGGAYVPMEVGQPEERKRKMVKDAGMRMIIRGGEGEREEEEVEEVRIGREWEEISKESRENLEKEVEGDNLAYIIYTSGSTGVPKGVCIPHSSAANHLLAIRDQFQLLPSDRVLQFAPVNLDVSFEQIFATLSTGATLVLRDPQVWSTSELLDKIEELRLTVIDLPAAYWHQVVKDMQQDSKPSSMNRLKLMIVGGDAMLPEPARLWKQSHSQAVRLVNAYGPTEATITSTLYELPKEIKTERIAIGRPVGDRAAYILDERGNPVAVGVIGELHIGGSLLARCYLNRADMTAEKFTPDEYGGREGGRLYKTGDLARYRADGAIEFVGRGDGQVKIRGYRIEVGEIEVVMMGMEGVREAAVIVREMGEGEKRLEGYVEMVEGRRERGREVGRYMRERVPEYMVPSRIEEVERMPKKGSGKVDREELKRISERIEEEGEREKKTETEEMMAGIWRRVLGRKDVSLNDNFFELGGHSILCLQVASRIRETFKVELPVRELFEALTLAELVERVETALRNGSKLLTPPIERISRDGNLPLSSSQARLWFLDQLSPDSATYNIPAALRIKGIISVDALKACLNEILARHEGFRASFIVEQGSPVQRIAASVDLPIQIINLENESQEALSENVMEIVLQEARRPFDLTQAPLLRVVLIRLGDDDHILTLNIHHIISDGWSMEILVNEFTALYDSFLKNQPSPLTELPIQYVDFANWQRGWLEGESLDVRIAYWKQKLEGITLMLDLPTDRPRPAVQNFAGASKSLFLPKHISDALADLSLKKNVTLFMSLLAAFKTLLYRYTGQDDLVVGTAISGRNRLELEPIIGFFVNMLALRTRLSDHLTFSQLLDQVRETLLQAYAFQDLPFDKLVEAISPERNLSLHPVFQTTFSFEPDSIDQPSITSLSVTREEVETATSKFDLSLGIQETAEGMVATIEYSTELFDETTIARMLGHLRNLLESIIENPEQAISEMRMLTDEEREQMVREWNETEKEYRTGECVHEMIEEAAARNGEAVAVEEGGERISYEEMNGRANQMGRYLRKKGLRAEERVGIEMERGIEMVISVLGVMKAGGAYVPMEVGQPEERKRKMVKDAGMRMIIRGGEGEREEEEVEEVRIGREWEEISKESRENLEKEVEGDNLAYIIYTSGSTGRPKGVMITHRGIVNYLSWCRETYEIESAEGAPVQSPLGFDLTVTSLLGPLVSGRRADLVKEERGLEELMKALKNVGEYSLVKLTPSHLKGMEEGIKNGDLRGKIRRLVVGGEELKWERVRAWMERAPGVKIVNEYGPTETVVGSIAYEVTETRTEEGEVPIGKPIANTRVYLLDKSLNPVGIGITGELYIAGESLGRGYAGRADLTAERFIPNPFGERPGERMYKTGDMARYLPDGNLAFLGRRDNQIKIRGYRIELGEIESALARHQALKDCVVIAREDARGDKQLVAYVVGTEDTLTQDELARHLREKLLEYMVPSQFVFLDELPLSSNGKVDRSALPVPELKRAGFIEPRTDVEEMLAGLWAEILQIERVGVSDNFFDLGGHSLLVGMVISRINAAFQIEMQVRHMFESPFLADLADRIEAMMRETEESETLSHLRSCVVAMRPSGSKLPFFCVHPVDGMALCYSALMHHLGSEQPFYGIQSPGWDETHPSHTSIEEMAAHYIGAIREVQPEGPYLLGGWSMGGIVAYEMSRQLQMQGEQVPLLVPIDALVPIAGQRRSEDDTDENRLLTNFALYLGLSLEQLGTWREMLTKLGPEEKLDYVLREARLANKVSRHIELSHIQVHINIFKNHINAMGKYLPEPHSVRVALFKTQSTSRIIGAEDPTLGWQRLSTGKIDVYELPGDHFTIIREPQVSLLAKRIQQCFSEVEGK